MVLFGDGYWVVGNWFWDFTAESTATILFFFSCIGQVSLVRWICENFRGE
jgi:hypothetical protein